MKLFHKLNSRGIVQHFALIIVVVAVAVGGTAYLVASHADSFSTVSTSDCTKTGTVKVDEKTKVGGRTTFSYKFNSYNSLSNGSSGKCVKHVQAYLNTFCKNNITVDGQYGAKTESAVRAFQKSIADQNGSDPTFYENGSLTGVDGAVGPQTWGLMQLIHGTGSTLNC